VPAIIVIFNQLVFAQQIFTKSTNTKLVKISAKEAQLLHADGQTDRHGEANRRFYRKAPKNKRKLFKRFVCGKVS